MADLTDAVGRTPLHYAAKSGCMKTVQFLATFVDARILDIFSRCFSDYLKCFALQKRTPLCLCCRGGSYFGLHDTAALYQQILFRSTVQSTSVPCSIAKIEGSIPIQIDQVYVFNAIDKYTRTPTSKQWDNLLRIWNPPDKKLNFAGIGIQFINVEE